MKDQKVDWSRAFDAVEEGTAIISIDTKKATDRRQAEETQDEV